MTKHRSPDERSAQILMAARQCFLDRGYSATKMDDIARHSGLSKGGIYFHFSSKKEIFRTLVQEEFDVSSAFIAEVMNSEADLIARLIRLARHFLEQFVADPDQSRFMLVAGQMALHDEATRLLLLKLQDSYIAQITDLLDEAVSDGALRPVDTETTAILVKALLDGVQASIAVGYSPDLLKILPAAIDLLSYGLIPAD